MAINYINYWLKASNGNGHGVHSPFVFDFIINVLNDKREFYSFKKIEKRRTELLNDNTVIQVSDFGVGSKLMIDKKRKVSNIASSSLKQKKFGQLLFKMVDYYHPENILELGTSLGITTSYLASANANNKITTLEGADEIAKIAQQNFLDFNLKNIELVLGNFDETLDTVLSSKNKIDLAFIDGNHRYKPTKEYFDKILIKSTEFSIIILDDIHWSEEMEQAWDYAKNHESVTATIDLFFIGIVLLRNDFKAKQHFIIKF